MARIAVIGAGAAGISAARTLVPAGHDVVLVEAGTQIGGRVRTDVSFASHPVELGAEFVHGERIATWPWIRDCGARTTGAAHTYRMWFHLDGHLLDRGEAGVEFGTDPLLAIGRLTEQWLAAGRTDASLDHVLELWPEISPQPLTPERRRLIANYFAELAATDLEDAGIGSAMPRVTELPETLRHFRLTDGYAALMIQAASGLPIELNAPVRTVHWDDRSAELTVGGRVERFDRAIVTLPLGILKRGDVEFSPPLPAAKQDAVVRLNAGHISKVILRFDQVYWPADMTFLWTTRSTQVWWRPGQGQPNEEPIVTAFFGGRDAAALETASTEDAAEEAARQLGDILGASLSDRVRDARYIAWGAEPYIAMGYSSRPPHGLGLRDALAAPCGAVHFAGEATNSDHPATVHGAIESGQRAAREVLNSLR
ncbi:MAG: flavin monoamine oxidase family protein [Dehalococcoidia bacterium]